MMFDDTYHTIAREAEGLYKEKGSKFISYALLVYSEEEFKIRLDAIKKEHHNARHYCYAYMIGPDKACHRANDDGEPSGTAGKPIFNQILSLDLTHIGVVVVRYFGGTKLGVSGLIRAYKTAAREALEKAGKKTNTLNERYALKFAYPLMNEVMRLLKEEQLEQLNPRFEMDCYFEISIRKREALRIIEKFERLFGLNVQYLRTE